MTKPGRIATASMSREISQLNAYDGLTTLEDIDSTGSAGFMKHDSGFAAETIDDRR